MNITTEQILELIKEHLIEEEVDDDGHTWIEFSGTPQKLIEFADKIYLIGWGHGYKQCLDELNPSIEDLLKSCNDQ